MIDTSCVQVMWLMRGGAAQPGDGDIPQADLARVLPLPLLTSSPPASGPCESVLAALRDCLSSLPWRRR